MKQLPLLNRVFFVSFISVDEILLLENVIRPLIQYDTPIPKTITDYEKYCIYIYFHGYPVGCCSDMSDPLITREKELLKHVDTCFVAPSTITSFKSNELVNGLFYVSPEPCESEYICDYGGVLYLSRDEERDNGFFGFPERAFKISTQPFKRWGFTIFVVGSPNCAGTYANEIRDDTEIKDLSVEETEAFRLDKKNAINCVFAENRCVQYSTRKRMFKSFDVFIDWLKNPLGLWRKREMKDFTEIFVDYYS